MLSFSHRSLSNESALLFSLLLPTVKKRSLSKTVDSDLHPAACRANQTSLSTPLVQLEVPESAATVPLPGNIIRYVVRPFDPPFSTHLFGPIFFDASSSVLLDHHPVVSIDLPAVLLSSFGDSTGPSASSLQRSLYTNETLDASFRNHQRSEQGQACVVPLSATFI